MHEIEIARNSHLIDPHLHIWGWQVPVYLFLGGLAAGIMIFSGLFALHRHTEDRSHWSRWVAFLAPALLSLGMLALLLDLESKLHVWRFYATFQVASPMSWGSWILLLIYPATLTIGLATLTDSEIDRLVQWGPVRVLPCSGRLRQAARWASGQLTALAVANLILGIALGIYTGILLSALGARPAWNSAILGPLFLVSGFSTGASVMMLFPMKHDEHSLIQRWDIGAIVVEAALLFLFLSTLMTSGGQLGRSAASLFLGGSYTPLFWSLVVIVGLAVPLLLEVIEIIRRRPPSFVAPVMILIGGLALRWLLVLAGQV